MRKLLLLLLMSVAGNVAYAIDANPTDCKLQTVRDAIDKVQTGGVYGTVFLPQCTGANVGFWDDRLVIDASRGGGIRITGWTIVNDPGVCANPKLSRDPSVNSATGANGHTSAVDGTIIQDNLLSTVTQPGMIVFQNVSAGKPVRLDHITFRPGTGTSNLVDGYIYFSGGNPGPGRARVDNCHTELGFDRSRFAHIGNSWIYVVFDHNFWEYHDKSLMSIYFNNYGGGSQLIGNGSWADYPRYGYDSGVFLETNTMLKTGTVSLRGVFDGGNGCRVICRYNYFEDTKIVPHGTESTARGGRLAEVYNNTWFYSLPGQHFFSPRSGGGIIHDNVHLGGLPGKDNNLCVTVDNYREEDFNPDSTWGGDADGASVWDKNVTGVGANKWDRNLQVFVKGDTPYVFVAPPVAGTTSTPPPGASGKATGVGTNQMTDINVSFPTDPSVPGPIHITGGLKGYSISNYTAAITPNNNPISHKDATGATRRGLFITSNTEHTITYTGSSQPGHSLIFAVNDVYKIHRIMQQLDQMGGGRTVAVAGSASVPWIFGTTAPGYPYPDGAPTVEPMLSWRNSYYADSAGNGYRDLGIGGVMDASNPNGDPTNYVGTPTTNCSGQGGEPVTCTGINLGPSPSPAVTPPVGDPEHANQTSTVPTFAKTTYTAALNGPVAGPSPAMPYVGDYTYPHPCVTNWPSCSVANSAATTISPSQVTIFLNQNASIDLSSNGLPKPSLTPTPSPSPLPSWAVFTTPNGDGTIHISGTPTGTPTQYKFGFKATNSVAPAPGAYIGPFILDVITAGNTPPVVSITAPATGASYLTSDSITISATATDSDGIASVQFKDTVAGVTSNLGSADTSSPFSYGPSTFSAGSHSFTAVATDSNASPATTTSSAVSITVSATPTPTPVPMKPSPKGTYIFPTGFVQTGNTAGPPNNSVGTTINNADADGVRYLAQWKDIETAADTFNWAPMDEAILWAHNASKKVGIGINAGRHCPTWLYAAPYSVQSYALQDTPNIPVGTLIPDPNNAATYQVFLDRWQKFVQAFGDKYNNNPDVSFVVVTGIGVRDEWNIDGPKDTAYLADTQAKVDAWITHAKYIIDFTLAAFPSTTVEALIRPPFASFAASDAAGQSRAAQDPVTIMQAVTNYAEGAYPCTAILKQYGNGIAGLTASTTIATDPSAAEIFAHYTTNDTHSETANPSSSQTDLDQMLQRAIALKIRCIELNKSEFDKTDPAYISTIHTRGNEIRALPVCGAGPAPTPSPAQIIVKP